MGFLLVKDLFRAKSKKDFLKVWKILFSFAEKEIKESTRRKWCLNKFVFSTLMEKKLLFIKLCGLVVIQIIGDTLGGEGVRDSVTKWHKGEAGGLPNCHAILFSNFLILIFAFRPVFTSYHEIVQEGLKSAKKVSRIIWMALVYGPNSQTLVVKVS